MKKHLLFTTVLAIALCVICIALFPTEAKAATDGYLTYEIVDDKAVITDCDDSASGEITIPATLGGYPVTTIGEFAFAHLTNPLSVNTGNSVTIISDAAFLGCTGLEHITLGDGVSSIGSLAFEACENLQNFAVSANNPNYTSIDGVLFNKNATVLVFAPKTISGTYTVPAGVLTVGEYAFDGCMDLTGLVIGNNVTTISARAFNNCMNLNTVELGHRVETVGEYAFMNCNRMNKIAIPVITTRISDYAFRRCTALTDVYYAGTPTQWDAIIIGSNNDPLDSVTIHYESNSAVLYDPDYITYSIVSGEAIITDCDETVSGSITIPSALGGYPVTGIGEDAFQDCSSLTSITIPEGVTSIGDYAFDGCNSLTSINIPDSVISIGDYAFFDCSLISVTIGDGVTSIGRSAFAWCESLTSIAIPDSVTSIGDHSFWDCGSLESISIGNGVTSIGSSAFSSCSSLKSITIPDSVTSIGNSAFWNCSNLESITIPDGVTSIDNSVFNGCSRLTSITIPDSITSIGSSAFSSCSSLKSIAIPDSVTSIGSSAFWCCSNLECVTIPDGVTSIGNHTFYSCGSLTSITIPDSITSIGNYAFEDCDNLTDVYYGGTEAQWAQISIGSDNDDLTSANIHFADPKYLSYNIYEGGAYVTDCDESVTGSITIPDTLGGYPVVGIDPWAFQNCDTITEIHLPDSVNYIGINAFAYCYSLTTVTMSNNVSVIGEGAFAGCTSLTDFDLPDNITMLEASTFYGCASLAEITIPDGVAVIGESAFNGCTYLSHIEIPSSVSIIGNYAFVDCTSLTDVILPYGVTSIGESAFQKCTSLKNISLPNSLASIGKYAFKECNWLKSIVIPDSVTTVGNNAFEYCSNLKSAVVGSGLTEIPSGMFWANVSMTNITFANTLTSVPDDTFYFCDNLTDVYYRGTQTQKDNITINDERIASATWHCNSCIGAAEHDFVKSVSKATLSENGLIVENCDVCGADGATTTIPRVDAFSLPGHILIADGTEKKPVPIVWDCEGNALTEGIDYTVTYPANAIEAGDYELLITLTGNYSGERILHYIIEPALEITKQPTTQKVKAGATVKFSVGTIGFGVDYQWQSSTNGKTWKNCSSSSATKATFSFTSKTSHSSNYYRCKVTDYEGNVLYTNAVRLYVLGITTQPKTQKVEAGEKATFTVAASGAGKTYQWQSSTDGKTWKNCSSSSAAKATFTFTSKTSHNGNFYRCVVKDNAGNTVYTDAVRLYVLGITSQPKTQKVKTGTTAKFTVKATGTGLKYQWQSSADGKTWKNCSSTSATKATFSFTGKTSHNGNYYRCKVTDSAGNVVYTSNVRLYVLGITEQPVSKTVTKGKTAKFAIEATGSGLKYQWQSSTDGGKTWKNCSSTSARKATFTFTSKTTHNGNYYRCKITDSAGNVIYTGKVKLTVKK